MLLKNTLYYDHEQAQIIFYYSDFFSNLQHVVLIQTCPVLLTPPARAAL